MHRSFVADSKLIQSLELRSVPVLCQKGEVLFRQGEACKGLYVVKSGELSLVLAAENGREVMQLAVGSGCLLGVPAVVGKGPYTLTAKALVDSKVGLIALREFEDLMEAQPALFPSVLAVLAAGVRSGRLALTRIMSENGCRFSEH